jgi:hypothetical protein
MSWKRVLAGLAFATAVFIAVPNRTAAQSLVTTQAAGCYGWIINQSGATGKVKLEYDNPLEMNHEGRTERPSDLAIASANLGSPQTCFIDGNAIDIVYNAVLTNADGTSYGVNGVAAAAAIGNAPGVTLPTGAYQIYDNDSPATFSVTATVYTVTTVGGGTGTDFHFVVNTGAHAGTSKKPDLSCLNANSGAGCEPVLVLQNLRFDVVGEPNSLTITPGGLPFNAVISVAGPDDCVTGTIAGVDLALLPDNCLDTSTFDPVIQVGTIRNTIYCAGSESMNFSNYGDAPYTDFACADVFRIGLGYEDGVDPYIMHPYPLENPSCTGGCPQGEPTGGVGNETGFLIKNAYWYMFENPYWTYVNPFRIALNGRAEPGPDPYSPVASDINTTPTDLVVDIETVPYGVSIEVPSTLTICNGLKPGVQWKLASGTSSVTGNSTLPYTANLIAIYQTVLGDVNDPSPGVPLVVATGRAASDAICAGGSTLFPTFGVQIADPSGIGNVTLRVVFGPSEGPGEFTGDDVNPTAVPRYMNPITPSEGLNPGSESRGIIDDAFGNPVCYIEIDPTRTYLLYDYVTDMDSWGTGIEVANTGNDAQAFAPLGVENAGQSGALDIWFFPNSNPEGAAGTTPFVYTAKAGDGRGLQTASGLLAPGNIWADSIDSLLTASGNGSLVGHFDGYLIIVCHFNFGHGAAYIFNAALNGTNVPALVLGGDSARMGDVEKLPERLVQ